MALMPFFQELVQTGLGGCHGLDLDDLVHTLLTNQVKGDLVCLVSIARPVHGPPRAVKLRSNCSSI